MKVSTLRSAARLEWSSFFAEGKAWQKKAGTEGGKAAQIILFIKLIRMLFFDSFNSSKNFIFQRILVFL